MVVSSSRVAGDRGPCCDAEVVQVRHGPQRSSGHRREADRPLAVGGSRGSAAMRNERRCSGCGCSSDWGRIRRYSLGKRVDRVVRGRFRNIRRRSRANGSRFKVVGAVARRSDSTRHDGRSRKGHGRESGRGAEQASSSICPRKGCRETEVEYKYRDNRRITRRAAGMLQGSVNSQRVS